MKKYIILLTILLSTNVFSQENSFELKNNQTEQLLLDFKNNNENNLILLNEDIKKQSINSQINDVGSTAIGLVLGASEANPLGIGVLGIKYLAAKEIEKKPIEEQTQLWNQYGAFAHGASINNLCIIGSILTSGSFAPLCPILGFISGKQYYDNNEEKLKQISLKNEKELFDELCQKEKIINKNINCIYIK